MSLEVDPTLAHDTEATIEQAQRFHDWVDRPNLYVKIPATKAGLPAIEEMIARGKSINVTLIFSLAALPRGRRGVHPRRRAPRRGRRRPGDGHVGRELLRLARRHGGRQAARGDRTDEALALRGKLAIANAKLAYEAYGEIFSGERWERLAGGSPQRCLWASTSTKNPDYRDVMYVEELIGPETVNTMPLETVRAFQDHGNVARTLDQGLDEAQRVFDDLARVGVDYDDVDRHARARGRGEVRAVVRGAARRRPGEARRAGRGMKRTARCETVRAVSTVAGTEIVERIWARDPTLWTGHDEAEWLGWLDEPVRMLERLELVNAVGDAADYDTSSCSAWAARASRRR